MSGGGFSGIGCSEDGAGCGAVAAGVEQDERDEWNASRRSEVRLAAAQEKSCT